MPYGGLWYNTHYVPWKAINSTGTLIRQYILRNTSSLLQLALIKKVCQCKADLFFSGNLHGLQWGFKILPVLEIVLFSSWILIRDLKQSGMVELGIISFTPAFPFWAVFCIISSLCGSFFEKSKIHSKAYGAHSGWEWSCPAADSPGSLYVYVAVTWNILCPSAHPAFQLYLAWRQVLSLFLALSPGWCFEKSPSALEEQILMSQCKAWHTPAAYKLLFCTVQWPHLLSAL